MLAQRVLSPNDTGVAWNFAVSLNNAGLNEKAASAYLDVAELYRSFPEEDSPWLVGMCLYKAGECWAEIGDFNQAETALRKALTEEDMGREDLWSLLGQVLEQLGKNDEAKKAYKTAEDIQMEESEVNL